MAVDYVVRMLSQLDAAVNGADANKIFDIIVALEAFPMTESILRDTMIGKKLVQIKKQLINDRKLIDKIDKIIIQWRKLVSSVKESTSCGGSTSSAGDLRGTDILKGVSETRRRIIEAFSKELEKSIQIRKGQYTLRGGSLSRTSSGSLSRSSSGTKAAASVSSAPPLYSTTTYLAFSLETSINTKFPDQTDNGNYKRKVRSILSNLKNNEGLRYLLARLHTNSFAHSQIKV